jgi:hypothetical protein
MGNLDKYCSLPASLRVRHPIAGSAGVFQCDMIAAFLALPRRVCGKAYRLRQDSRTGAKYGL